MTAPIATENASFKYEVVIDAIRATVPSAGSSVLPFCNQLSEHNNLLMNVLFWLYRHLISGIFASMTVAIAVLPYGFDGCTSSFAR